MESQRGEDVCVRIFSKHKSMTILQKLFKHDKTISCDFFNPRGKINHIKNTIVIMDQADYNKNDWIKQPFYKAIILKDAQKSDASILALSGQLSTFGQNQKQEFVPSYLVDFTVAISLSILIRQMNLHDDKEKQQRIFKISLIDIVRYFGAFNVSAKQNGFLKNPLGKNLLDGGTPFYNLYKCKQGTIAVGNLEPKFYQEMVKAFKFEKTKQTYLIENQLNPKQWPKIKDFLTSIFVTKTATQWQKIMSTYDTCVTQVLQTPKKIQTPSPKIYPLVKPKL